VTTVIACRPMATMVADSNVDHGDVHFTSKRKVQKIGKYIVGVAGDYSHALRYIQAFAEVAKQMDGKSAPLLVAMDGEFDILVLSEHGLWIYGDDGTPIEVEDEWYAIGSGGGWAAASLRTQELTCTPYNLQMAMEVACEYDRDSRLPAVELTLATRKKKE
jgi:ATP-dependent protease HslVU (ClpYQ) peptidase subunit